MPHAFSLSSLKKTLSDSIVTPSTFLIFLCVYFLIFILLGGFSTSFSYIVIKKEILSDNWTTLGIALANFGAIVGPLLSAIGLHRKLYLTLIFFSLFLILSGFLWAYFFLSFSDVILAYLFFHLGKGCLYGLVITGLSGLMKGPYTLITWVGISTLGILGETLGDAGGGLIRFTPWLLILGILCLIASGVLIFFKARCKAAYPLLFLQKPPVPSNRSLFLHSFFLYLKIMPISLAAMVITGAPEEGHLFIDQCIRMGLGEKAYEIHQSLFFLACGIFGLFLAIRIQRWNKRMVIGLLSLSIGVGGILMFSALTPQTLFLGHFFTLLGRIGLWTVVVNLLTLHVHQTHSISFAFGFALLDGTRGLSRIFSSFINDTVYQIFPPLGPGIFWSLLALAMILLLIFYTPLPLDTSSKSLDLRGPPQM